MAHGVKEWKFSLRELNCSFQDLDNVAVDVGVTIDTSWCSRAWTATNPVTAAISVDTEKVIDVVHTSSSCNEGKKMEKKRSDGDLSRLEHLAWLNNHEPNCFMNHKGSSAVSLKNNNFVNFKRRVFISIQPNDDFTIISLLVRIRVKYPCV